MKIRAYKNENPLEELIDVLKKASRKGCDSVEIRLGFDEINKLLKELQWALSMDTADTPQTETQNSNKNANVISVYDGVSEAVRCAMCSNPNKSDRGCDGACSYDEKLYERIMKAIAESVADTPQTERSSE